jgi:CO/xanthine dehydrogenase FAD-binding subunit
MYTYKYWGQMTAYFRPSRLEDAVGLMAGGTCTLLAGGTDIYPSNGMAAGDVLDLTAITDLRGITEGPAGLRIGGAVTWSEIAEADLPPALSALQMAARAVGGRQIQNAGTIAGNLCNASPAADGVPPLLVLEAEVELASVRGMRRMALAAFLLGPRRTARAVDEVLVAVHVPARALAGQSTFLKLGARAYLVISIASVAVRIVSAGGLVTEIAVAVGACSGVPQRLPLVEAALMGAPLPALGGLVRRQDVAAGLSAIDDIRATAGYRVDAAAELVARACMAAGAA